MGEILPEGDLAEEIGQDYRGSNSYGQWKNSPKEPVETQLRGSVWRQPQSFRFFAAGRERDLGCALAPAIELGELRGRRSEVRRCKTRMTFP